MKFNFFRQFGLVVMTLLLLVVGVSVFTEVVPTVLANVDQGLAIPSGEVPISEAISQRTFGETLVAIVNYFVGFLGFLATLAFVYAGVLWVLSGGNEESITKARKVMIYAALGLLVVILSFSIVRFITGSAGVAGSICQDNSDCTGTNICVFDETSGENICAAPQAAPTGPECRSNLECATNSPSTPYCVFNEVDRTNRCVAEDPGELVRCIENSDCPQGRTCEEGICALNFTGFPPPNPGAPGCQTTSECILTQGANTICVFDTQRVANTCEERPLLQRCSSTGGCPAGFVCDESSNPTQCVPDESILPPQPNVPGCRSNAECQAGEICRYDRPSNENLCSPRPQLSQCSSDSDCSTGFACEERYQSCVPLSAWLPPNSAALGCLADSDCASGELCSYHPPQHYNYCVPGDSVAGCTSDADCSLNYICSASNRCSYQPDSGSGRPGGQTTQPVTGGSSSPVVDERIDTIDDLIQALERELDISNLPRPVQDEVKRQLQVGGIESKIRNIEDMIANPSTYNLSPSDVRALEELLRGLERLKILRDELDDLRIDMPESADIVAAYDSTSDTLDELMEDPTNAVLMRRFTARYKELKDLIRAYPVVQAVIRALPAEGNAPLTVQLDALDSIDPTGGTISDYRWSFLDNSGSEVSLGSESVVLHEFAEPNTYVVRLRAGTAQRDAEGYKTAGDGVSTIRIKVLPPASEVRFRIDGVDVLDLHHVTLEEAQSGLSFDPSQTSPALGRQIVRYSWSYGDTVVEERNAPTTVVHAYEKPGEYFVKLEVTDNLGVKDKKISKLFVKSLAADLVVTPKKGNVNTEFKFSGQKSRSDDGFIQDFEWEIQDTEGRTVADSEEELFMHRFDRPGLYRVRLTVTDITGATDTILNELEVESRKPIANFRFETPEANHPNTLEFNGIDSYDPDEGDFLTYSWDFDGDGDFEIVDSNEALATYEYERVGEYRATLQVEDAFGQRDQVEKRVSVDSVLSGDIVAETRATRVGEPINFSADSDTAVAYLWEFGDGETATTEEEAVSHTYSRTGKFTVRMHFFDRDDNDNTDTLRILVGPGEEPLAAINHVVSGREPVVIEDLCGNDQPGTLVTRADTIRFDGRDSINTDGSSRLLAYDWRFPDGQRSSNKETTYKYDEINRQGECFTVSLVVRDTLTGKLSPADEIYFKVVNELPEITDFVIESSDDETLVTPTKVRLRVVNPKDRDGSIKKYRWWYYRDAFEQEKLGIHTTADPNTEMIVTSFGEPDLINRYFFVVEVTDNDNGFISSEERFGEVSYLDVQNGPNLSPVADFTLDKTTISVGDSITFVSRSYDPQGEDLPSAAFRWDFDGDGQFDDTSTGAQVNRQFNTPGEYEVRLKVVHRGLSSSSTKTVFVEATDSFPQPAFTYTVDDNTVTFDASPSRYDPDLADTTLRFEWDFDIDTDANGNGIKDDDVQATDLRTTHTYSEKKLYKARLKVKDSLGSEGVVVRDVNLNLTEAERQQAAYRSLRVSAPKHSLTTLDLDVIPAVLDRGSSSDLKVRVLNADGTPYTGVVFFEILDGSGSFTPNPVIAEDSKAATIFTATDSGRVRVRVRATDTIYGELTEEAVITVK